MSGPLKLRAEDADDFAIISACLQDALVPVGDMAYLRDEQAFVLTVNRFCWENCTETFDSPVPDGESAPDPALEGCSNYERVNCVVRFDHVAVVRHRGLDLTDRGRVLELLTLETSPNAVTLVFADGAEIRFEGEAVRCRLHDMGEPWPTQWRPRHLIQGETPG
jgi:Protein of unknown function (DUF2948)